MLNGMKLFSLGFSWGAFESLMIATDPSPIRSATTWKSKGQCLRVHAGQEDPDDLINDLEDGFNHLKVKA